MTDLQGKFAIGDRVAVTNHQFPDDPLHGAQRAGKVIQTLYHLDTAAVRIIVTHGADVGLDLTYGDVELEYID
ncbi:hypothetical protein SEA_PERIWINKLE_49 [Gordonia phage Periwinkle]|nr:hypothetical protein SEA_PERIWINKLE_49 [Gordonia phage Periwinkle]